MCPMYPSSSVLRYNNNIAGLLTLIALSQLISCDESANFVIFWQLSLWIGPGVVSLSLGLLYVTRGLSVVSHIP